MSARGSREAIVTALVATGFVACVWGANWMITHVGTPHPSGARTIPVGFGWVAPSGVVLVGASLTLRDTLQRRTGARFVVGAIVIGAALSAFLSPALAYASGLTFLVSELADFAVYTPLRRRNFFVAVLASNAVGAVVDSLLFLTLAFGASQAAALVGPLTLGKVEWSLLALAMLVLARASAEVACRQAARLPSNAGHLRGPR